MNTKQVTWLENATRYGGSFVHNLARTCYTADEDNFKILSPALEQFINKYPQYSEKHNEEKDEE